MVPVWRKDTYHLHGNYCSWNCAKADVIVKAKTFPQNLTALAVFAYKVSFRGRQREHPASHTRFCGVLPAPPKETLQAFGGHLSIHQFRREFLTINSYQWVTRVYRPREPSRVPQAVDKRYFYTLQPVRKTIVLDDDDESDPVVFIKRRVF